MKKGLIMEGGAMLGIFTAGVIDVLMENKIEFDGAIGVSAGACFGCNYKSKQIGRVIRYNKKYINDERFCGPKVLLRTGNIYSTDFCYGTVPLEYDKFDFETYKNNKMDFYVVTTDVETGSPVYHKYEGYEDHGFDWIRASASMPLVSQMVEIDGVKMLDGGISDSVPLKYFQSLGYDKNVVILTKPYNYQKTENKLMPLVKIKYKNYPNLVNTIKNRHIIYNKNLEYIKEKEKAGEIFVIRPEEALPLKRVEKDPDKLETGYKIGRQTAYNKLRELTEYLTK